MSDDDATFDDSRMSIGSHLEELRWHVLKAVGYVSIAFVIAFYLQGPLLKVAQWPYERAAKNVIDSRVIPGVDNDLRDSLVAVDDGYRQLDQSLNEAAKDELLLLDALEPGQLQKDLEQLLEQQASLGKEIAELQERYVALLDADEVSFQQILDLRAEREGLLAQQRQLQSVIEERVGPFKDRMAKLPRMELTQIRPQEAFLSALKLSLVVALFCASPLVARELWSFVSKGLYHHEKYDALLRR
ncbi:MAG: twin-arginine translocase subunit TatC [Planctomycetota bacterium]